MIINLGAVQQILMLKYLNIYCIPSNIHFFCIMEVIMEDKTFFLNLMVLKFSLIFFNRIWFNS